MTTIDILESNIAELESKNAALEKRIAALEPKPVKLSPSIDEGASFHIAVPEAPKDFAFPNADELGQLKAIVLAAHPDLAPKNDEDEIASFNRAFCGAFDALATMRRTETPDFKRYASTFCKEAQSRMRRIGGYGYDLEWKPFFAAVLACGDIPYTEGGKELGLNLYESGRVADNSWRWVLETGKLLKVADGPDYRKHEKQPQQRVLVSGGW